MIVENSFVFGNGQGIAALFQEAGNVPAQFRMHQQRRDLLHWHQRESPIMKFGMRQTKEGIFVDLIIVEKNINVNEAGTIFFIAGAPHRFLDPENAAHQLARVKSGGDLQRLVQEGRLIFQSPGRRFIKRGALNDRTALFPNKDRSFFQCGPAVTEVGSQEKISAVHRGNLQI